MSVKFSEKDIIRKCIKERQWTQQDLAEAMGYSSQGSVGQMLSRPSMRVDTLVKVLDILGYDLIVKDRGEITKPTEWTVGGHSNDT